MDDRRTSADHLWGWHTIITDGSPYMTRVWFGRLRVHVFYRGDADQDPHDHPWDFWTFPLTSYVEEVTTIDSELSGYQTKRQVVRAFWPSFRPATHTHRVLGRYVPDHSEAIYGLKFDGRRIITIVWRSEFKRKWGFLKHKDGRWCWQAWRDYAIHGGKNAPCE